MNGRVCFKGVCSASHVVQMRTITNGRVVVVDFVVVFVVGEIYVYMRDALAFRGLILGTKLLHEIIRTRTL